MYFLHCMYNIYSFMCTYILYARIARYLPTVMFLGITPGGYNRHPQSIYKRPLL